jgi:mannose/fructose/N-acetylgalactosamine-specific phosphotransferase system component IIC
MKNSNRGYISSELIGILFLLAVIGGLFGLLFLGTAGFPGGINPNYSDGTRAGTVIKLSHKGTIWKSWEGTMNMGGFVSDGKSGVVVNTFDFNVTDAVAPEVQAALDSGAPVKVTYHQYFIVPWQISSSYVVTKVEAK